MAQLNVIKRTLPRLFGETKGEEDEVFPPLNAKELKDLQLFLEKANLPLGVPDSCIEYPAFVDPDKMINVTATMSGNDSEGGIPFVTLQLTVAEQMAEALRFWEFRPLDSNPLIWRSPYFDSLQGIQDLWYSMGESANRLRLSYATGEDVQEVNNATGSYGFSEAYVPVGSSASIVTSNEGRHGLQFHFGLMKFDEEAELFTVPGSPKGTLLAPLYYGEKDYRKTKSYCEIPLHAVGSHSHSFPALFVEALEELRKDPETRKALTQAGSRTYLRFDEALTLRVLQGETAPVPLIDLPDGFDFGRRKFVGGTIFYDEISEERREILLTNPSVVLSEHADAIMKTRDSLPFEDTELQPYQKVAASRGVTSPVGVLMALDTGHGKTYASLAACHELAKNKQDFLGLIVCESGLVNQWEGEVTKWFGKDAFNVVLVQSKKAGYKELDRLKQQRELAPPHPTLIIATYSMAGEVYNAIEAKRAMNTYGSFENIPFKNDENPEGLEFPTKLGVEFFASKYDVLVVDEAKAIGGNSKQAKSLWHLRGQSGKTFLLTATPFKKSPNDIAPLLEFVLNSRDFFYGVDFTKVFSLATEADQEIWARSLEPLLYRYSTDVDMPEHEIITHQVPVSPAELRLNRGLTSGMRGLVTQLIESVEQVNAIKEKRGVERTEEDLEAMEKLRNLQGMVSGSMTLARLSTSYPGGIAASKTASSAIVESAGLLEPFRHEDYVPSKALALLHLCEEAVAEGRQVIVFTSFATCCDFLTEYLKDSGFSVGKYSSQGSRLARGRELDEFQRGERQILVCSDAAMRGLNLQNAGALVHYDLDFKPNAYEQRVGRIIRQNAAHNKVSIHVLIMGGTTDERTVATVIGRSIQNMAALDGTFGTANQKKVVAYRGMLENLDTDGMSLTPTQGRLIAEARAMLGEEMMEDA